MSQSTLRNEKQTFDQRVIPLAKQKFNLNLCDYSSLQKCAELLKDVFVVFQELRRKNLQPAMTRLTPLLRKHKNLIAGAVGFGVEYLINQMSCDEVLKRHVKDKICFVLQSISVSFRFALVFVFLYQCYELYAINESIKEALAVISDEEVRAKFLLIEKNIARLKEIADEVDRLVELWEVEENEYEKKQLWELIALTLDAATNKEYRETCDTIGELRTRIHTQRQMLEQNRSKVAAGGLLSSLGMLSVLAIDLIPVVGTITTCVSLVSYTVAMAKAIEIKKKLDSISKNLQMLSTYDRELEEVMDHIRAQQDWMAQKSELDFEL